MNNIPDKYKVEVKYQSNFSIIVSKIKEVLGSIIRPVLGILVFLAGLYLMGYIILFFLFFFLLLYIYNRVKKIF